MPSNIDYHVGEKPDTREVIALFDASGIRRPTGEPERIAKMFAAHCLVVSARANGRLVGVSRALTDDVYCCYLSDLAVDRAYQDRGIGRELVRLTREAVGEAVSVVLVAAPDAVGFYSKAGFELCDRAFVVHRTR
ncbi:MAG: GNAT family N-acetyltransferase [Gammaproteobacteria bacterium]|nr:GNAT family N-acetyltransferase [Gammaproteobacteria bacterium]MBI5616799.1 GNAT family N-acetyltransferase [Gammaproteobacteria bacterium]